MGEVHGEERAIAYLVEADRDPVVDPADLPLHPAHLLRLDEPGRVHRQLGEPAAVDELRRPRDSDERGGRAQAERAGLHEGDEWRSVGLWLDPPLVAQVARGESDGY